MRRGCPEIDPREDRRLVATLSDRGLDELEYAMVSARDAIEGLLFRAIWSDEVDTDLRELNRLRLESDMLRIDQFRADLFAIPEAPDHYVFMVNDDGGTEIWADVVAAPFWRQILLAAQRHSTRPTMSLDGDPMPGSDSSHPDSMLARLLVDAPSRPRR